MINDKLTKKLQEQITENKNDIDNMKPYILYNNIDGENTSLTLSDKYQNYRKLMIYFYCNVNKVAYFSQEIDTTIDNFNLMGFFKASDYVGQLVSEKFQMNDKTISYINNARANLNSNWSTSQITYNTKDIYIYKVIGYK